MILFDQPFAFVPEGPMFDASEPQVPANTQDPSITATFSDPLPPVTQPVASLPPALDATLYANNGIQPLQLWRLEKFGLGHAKMELGNDYALSFYEGASEVLIENRSTQTETRIFGNAQVELNGEELFQFWGTATFELANGTKITANTVPVPDNAQAYMLDRLTITDDTHAVVITGVNDIVVGDLNAHIMADPTLSVGTMAEEKVLQKLAAIEAIEPPPVFEAQTEILIAPQTLEAAHPALLNDETSQAVIQQIMAEDVPSTGSPIEQAPVGTTDAPLIKTPAATELYQAPDTVAVISETPAQTPIDIVQVPVTDVETSSAINTMQNDVPNIDAIVEITAPAGPVTNHAPELSAPLDDAKPTEVLPPPSPVLAVADQPVATTEIAVDQPEAATENAQVQPVMHSQPEHQINAAIEAAWDVDDTVRDGFVLKEAANSNGWLVEDESHIATKADLNETAIGAEFGPGSDTMSIGEFGVHFVRTFTQGLAFGFVDMARTVTEEMQASQARNDEDSSQAAERSNQNRRLALGLDQAHQGWMTGLEAFALKEARRA